MTTLSKRFSTWKARRILSWHDVCPKHLLDRGWNDDHEEIGCPTCLNEKHQIWSKKYWAKRAITDAKIADAKAKLPPIEEGTK